MNHVVLLSGWDALLTIFYMVVICLLTIMLEIGPKDFSFRCPVKVARILTAMSIFVKMWISLLTRCG